MSCTLFFFARPQSTAAPCKNIVALTLLIFAGPRRIELRPTDLEAVVLPLNYRPVTAILTCIVIRH